MFQKGDLVRCVEIANGLSLNDLYVIISEGNDPTNWVTVIDDEGDKKLFKSRRFKLVEKVSQFQPGDILKCVKSTNRVTEGMSYEVSYVGRAPDGFNT